MKFKMKAYNKKIEKNLNLNLFLFFKVRFINLRKINQTISHTQWQKFIS